jgi:GNAT superfamily N-acetyltransferase
MVAVASPSQRQTADDLVTRAFAPLRRVYVPSGEPAARPADSVCLVLVDGGAVVATLSYYVEPPCVRLYRIAVEPARQRQGLASQLIDYVDRTVAKPNGYALALYTIEQSGNVEVFRRLGFRVEKRAVAPFAQSPTGEPVHEVEMTRPASEASG